MMSKVGRGAKEGGERVLAGLGDSDDGSSSTCLRMDLYTEKEGAIAQREEPPLPTSFSCLRVRVWGAGSVRQRASRYASSWPRMFYTRKSTRSIDAPCHWAQGNGLWIRKVLDRKVRIELTTYRKVACRRRRLSYDRRLHDLASIE